jgi:hypothetical protein
MEKKIKSKKELINKLLVHVTPSPINIALIPPPKETINPQILNIVEEEDILFQRNYNIVSENNCLHITSTILFKFYKNKLDFALLDKDKILYTEEEYTNKKEKIVKVVLIQREFKYFVDKKLCRQIWKSLHDTYALVG